jgi:hypothetical protein
MTQYFKKEQGQKTFGQRIWNLPEPKLSDLKELKALRKV